MKRILVTLSAVVLWSGLVRGQQVVTLPGQDNRLFQQIEEMLGELSKISGLNRLRPIEHDLITRPQIRQFLDRRIEEEIKPEELRAEELALKKFGLVPQDFDLKKTTVELLTEQAAAFYDFRKKKLFILDSAPQALQQVALVHEIAHALADQHFNLEKFIDSGSRSDDGATARAAVMEGQATWLMSEYLARKTGQSLRTSPAILQLMVQSSRMSAGQFPVFDAAPLYLREGLLFPYVQGMLFQHAVVEKKGEQGFVEVFRKPPVSSEQILHPEKYFAGVVPANPGLPELKDRDQYSVLTEGSIGELDHEILLRQFIGEDEAKTLAPKWTGGQYRILEHKKDKRVVLSYVSQWETAEAARSYFARYRQMLQKKWKSMAVTAESKTSVAGRGDDGEFLLRLDGDKVSSVEGLAALSEAVEGNRRSDLE
jgi:hypothetical protein